LDQAKRLRALLSREGPIVVAGAHTGLSARLVEQAGFDAIWASGFEISAAKGVPDANVLTSTETLQAAREMADAAAIPVIADCDNGFGNAINVIRTVRDYEAAGVAAICIEDNVFPKRCSFYEGVRRELAPTDEHAGKVRAAKDAQRTPEFAVIARTEALIAGWGLDEALTRARAYADAGADMILVHSKQKDPGELIAFADKWDRPTPLVAVPTIYKTTKVDELYKHKYKLVIFANHALRASIKAMRETLAIIKEKQFAASVDDRIVKLQEVYDLVGVPDLEKNEAEYLPAGGEPVTAVILAAGFDPALMPLVADRPKPMLDVRGKTILERQVAMLRSCGVNDISVVRGYKKDSVAIPGIRYFDNDNFAESGEVASLFTAEKALKGRVLVLYGDVIMERSVIEKVIAAKADIAVSVDASFGREAHAHGNGNGNGHPHDGKAEGKTKTDLVKLAEAPPPILPRGRFVSEEGTTVPVTAIGRTLKEAHGEFSGILGLTSRGTDLVKKAYEQAKAAGLEAKFHESPSLRKAAMTDLVQELVRSKADVRGVLHWKGWMEVDSFDDYRRAWATTTS
jgi:phosphoenolpyruvate phosphomutase